MSNSILRYHFAMSKDRFPVHREQPREALSIEPVPLSVNAILARVERIPWDWINKEIYDPATLSRRIQHPDMALFDLLDEGKPVGYAIISPASHPKAFNAAAKGKSVIEIENLALFPKEEGGGRGWQFFSLVMDQLYENFDTVYWSQSSTNYATLKDYYIRKGMSYLGADRVPDFRQKALSPVAAFG
ncbi:MAG: hypothetical protein OIF58_10600 [Cohaesibacter sp.]|nr:hypothetical protein [Cohaesibacter sp.]